MKVFYCVEIQTEYPATVTDDMINYIMKSIGADSTDIDEREAYRVLLFFKSEIKSETMRKLIDSVVKFVTGVHYIDVIYRYEYEMNMDRFVYWSDGRRQEYTGKTIFVEDK